jgi:SagB-type dehydrogenase family enzyme
MKKEVEMGVGWDFVKKTMYHNLCPSDQMRGVPPPALETAHAHGMQPMELPKPDSIVVQSVDLRAAIEQRQSIRRYTDAPIMLDELSYLLWCTQGVRKLHPAAAATLRNVPSAGARHAFETYMLINRVKDLVPGIYRYLALEHNLLQLEVSPGISDRVVSACLGQEFAGTAAVTFMWVAVPSRMTWRYGERGYRYLYLDAGHVAQNLYLSAASVGCGVCAIAAFSDEEMNRLLGLDGERQFTIYVAAAGKI